MPHINDVLISLSILDDPAELEFSLQQDLRYIRI